MKTNNKLELKIISVCTLLLLSGMIIFAYTQYEDYRDSENRYSRIESTINEELDIFIKSILFENKEKGEINIEFYTNKIHEELLKAYNNDLDALEEDISNPEEDSKLVTLIDTILEDVYINKDTIHNKPLVGSLTNIIWNRVLPFNYESTDVIVTWDNFGSKHYNPILAEQAIKALKNMNMDKYDFIFWEAIPNTNPEHKIIESMDINDILKVYKKEGIEALKSYEILIPVYITRNGDIFGTKDINTLGHKIDNYKIIVIQRLNVYDALVPHLSAISFFENEIQNIQIESNSIMNQKAYNMIQSMIICIITLIGSSYLQKRFND